MKKAGLSLLLIVMFLVLILPAKAEISLEEPLSLYNLGQKIIIEPKITFTENFDGYFKLELLCQAQEQQEKQAIYFSPIVLEKNKEKTIDLSFQIIKKGVCYFEASLQDTKYETVELEKTKNFTSSDLINLEATINKDFFFPEEIFKIEGTAVKANGEPFEGQIDIKIENITLSSYVRDGNYRYEYKLPSDIRSKDKKVTISVEDGYGNKGQIIKTITIVAVPTNLVIEAYSNDQNAFVPGDVITIKATLFDQANDIINENIALKIENNRKAVHEEIIKSGESTIYKINKNEPSGNYILKVSSQGLESEKTIFLTELKEIKVELENKTLHIINIGNIPYKETIEIIFTAITEEIKETKTIELDLGVGQETFIKLEAPTGQYEIAVKDSSEESTTFSSVPLTGMVTAAVELKPGLTISSTIIFIVVGFVLLSALLLFIFNKRTKGRIKMMKKEIEKEEKQPKISQKPKSKVVGFEQKDEKKRVEEEIETKSGKVSLFSEKKKDNVVKERSFLKEPEDDFGKTVKKIFQQHSYKTGVKTVIPALIFAEKRPMTALILRIDGVDSLKKMREENPSFFEKILNDYFETIIDKIRRYQGVAEIYETDILVIFNAIKQYSHDIAAIKTASEIRDETMKFNEKYRMVEFHVASGINTGTAMLSSITENKILKYLPLEETTFIAKLLEQRANSDEIMISDNTYQRLKTTIDAKKMSPLFLSKQRAIDTYSIEKLSLKAKYKDYVDRVVREYNKQKDSFSSA